MEELVNTLVSRLGLDRDMAQKIATALQKHATDVVPAAAGGVEKMTQLVERFGVSHEIAARVAAFLVENASQLPKWLGVEAPGLVKKAMDAIGGVLGAKKT